MIYATNSSYYSSFLTSGRKKPTNEQVVTALDDIKKKVRSRRVASKPNFHDSPPPPPRAQNKHMTPEEMAATLRSKCGSPRRPRLRPTRRARRLGRRRRYPTWVLDDMDWAALSNMMEDD